MLKSWAFDDLKFHRAWLDCKDYNSRALHVYEKAGLVREGLIRETILTDGVYENLIILGILDREYFCAEAVPAKINRKCLVKKYFFVYHIFCVYMILFGISAKRE